MRPRDQESVCGENQLRKREPHPIYPEQQDQQEQQEQQEKQEQQEQLEKQGCELKMSVNTIRINCEKIVLMGRILLKN